MKARLFTGFAALAMFLTACEDEGNPGDDSLLSGGSLVLILVVLLIVGLWYFLTHRR